MEETPSGTTTDVYGPYPTGYLKHSVEGRMIALIVRGDRQRPAGAVPSATEAAALFRGMLSYAGTYVVSGDEITHHVDASWNEAWTGTDQRRLFRIEGRRLTACRGNDGDAVVIAGRPSGS